MPSKKSVKVSIIIRTYNSEKTLPFALESAINQTYSKDKYEIVIVDDASIDDTREVAKKMKFPKKKLIFNKKNLGAVASANLGIKKSTGKYVILLDSDDKFGENILEEMTEVLDNDHKVDFVYSDYYECINSKCKLISPKNIFETVAVGVMIRKDKLVKMGLYKNFFFAEYDLLLRTMEKWHEFHIPKPLFTYNRSKESLTSSSDRVLAGLRELKEAHAGKVNYINKIRTYSLS